eukprot:gnl/TRDRNA2_/TRDRNA2_28310_c0_seq1.p1 gnl/TRDRNA2_/TRDRNA2_28310_c0~~gnl/TRDRNA2_/TRDRNA2_28310_c0_seq1.p1  ORF type:complete len:617 (+),score=84.58 gnl/TRDRNA2_/TRDRNA2_28310_c0_seq1:107-1957(+)
MANEPVELMPDILVPPGTPPSACKSKRTGLGTTSSPAESKEAASKKLIAAFAALVLPPSLCGSDATPPRSLPDVRLDSPTASLPVEDYDARQRARPADDKRLDPVAEEAVHCTRTPLRSSTDGTTTPECKSGADVFTAHARPTWQAGRPTGAGLEQRLNWVESDLIYLNDEVAQLSQHLSSLSNQITTDLSGMRTEASQMSQVSCEVEQRMQTVLQQRCDTMEARLDAREKKLQGTAKEFAAIIDKMMSHIDEEFKRSQQALLVHAQKTEELLLQRIIESMDKSLSLGTVKLNQATDALIREISQKRGDGDDRALKSQQSSARSGGGADLSSSVTEGPLINGSLGPFTAALFGGREGASKASEEPSRAIDFAIPGPRAPVLTPRLLSARSNSSSTLPTGALPSSVDGWSSVSVPMLGSIRTLSPLARSVSVASAPAARSAVSRQHSCNLLSSARAVSPPCIQRHHSAGRSRPTSVDVDQRVRTYQYTTSSGASSGVSVHLRSNQFTEPFVPLQRVSGTSRLRVLSSDEKLLDRARGSSPVSIPTASLQAPASRLLPTKSVSHRFLTSAHHAPTPRQLVTSCVRDESAPSSCDACWPRDIHSGDHREGASGVRDGPL